MQGIRRNYPSYPCKLVVKKDNWIKKNKWDGIDPNNGDEYSKGKLIKEGPKQLEIFH